MDLRSVVAAAALAVPLDAWGQVAPAPIRDNSFLIEEAYNQDRGVVQHISTFADRRDGLWAFTLTDEWPLHDVRNQMSVGLELGDFGTGATTGNLAFNYRHQLVGNPEAAVIFSPRISLLGDLGSAAQTPFALQVNLPLTAVATGAIVTHWNAGVTLGAGPATVHAGASAVWLAVPWMNLLVEGVYFGASGEVPNFVVSPGVRWAVNLGSVQVVPGVALPVNLSDSSDDQLFLYLSVEHPFGPTE